MSFFALSEKKDLCRKNVSAKVLKIKRYRVSEDTVLTDGARIKYAFYSLLAEIIQLADGRPTVPKHYIRAAAARQAFLLDAPQSGADRIK